MGDITFGLTFAAVLTREVFSNQTALSKGLFYALSLLAIAIFVWGCLRRVRLWRLGRAAAKPLNLAAAGKHLVLDVLLQRRVLGRGWASVGHVLLFGGFMGLFLATTLLGIEHGLAILLGRAADDPVFHKGVYFVVYEMLADGFGIAMLVGCGIFAVRRWRRGDVDGPSLDRLVGAWGAGVLGGHGLRRRRPADHRGAHAAGGLLVRRTVVCAGVRGVRSARGRCDDGPLLVVVATRGRGAGVRRRVSLRAAAARDCRHAAAGAGAVAVGCDDQAGR